MHRALPLVSETLFNKTYFSLEETGLGYPRLCLPAGTTRMEQTTWDAFLCVFADAYRLQHDPWGGERPPWMSAQQIGPRNRIRRFASKVWPGDDVNARLEDVLRVLANAGHPQG